MRLGRSAEYALSDLQRGFIEIGLGSLSHG